MNSAIQSESFTNVDSKSKIIKETSSSAYWDKMEFHRSFITPILLVVVAVVGAVAGGIAIKQNMLTLEAVALAAMLVEAFILSVAPMKWIVNSTIISLLISTIVILSSFAG